MTRYIRQREAADDDTVRRGGCTRRFALWATVAAFAVPSVSAWAKRREERHGNQAKRIPSRRRKDLRSGSRAQSGSTRCSRRVLPARAGGSSVTFEPGARTAWHTHPLGQTLIVTAGAGRVQRWGGPVEEIRPGDVVWFPPGEKHWHGAAPTTAMTHIAIHEKLDGKVVDWLEHVTAAQYDGRSV